MTRKSGNTTLWLGPSEYTGEEVAVQAQCVYRPGETPKLGDMVPLAVWATAGPPSAPEVQETSCGGCALLAAKVCYVVKVRYRKSWERIQKVVRDLADFATEPRVRRRPHRITSDGDAAAVPISFWRRYFKVVRPRGWTAYIHGWKDRTTASGLHVKACDPEVAAFAMASCDTRAERAEAKALGFRTARVGVPGEPLDEGEIICPAILTKDRIQCAPDCLMCCGNAEWGKVPSIYFRHLDPSKWPDIVFPVHGGAGNEKKFLNMLETMEAA
jgi:hypothetical protein